ncbi:antitoxin Xre/MbcA/ParS toxin-binding domain-containing protein [Variovorax guangxiensis]|uniref:DUF2384 domain-containing protein n=1 Tax=Variovorax guangxiensis TaxID=1775474 RepID=A0A502DN29_9BURK|nr:DUF2384 domain-containing protein [Variovorax ginsengisoli]TPG26040.1 DUF2384 domain-containing protein [Variovorax guangxiensis]
MPYFPPHSDDNSSIQLKSIPLQAPWQTTTQPQIRRSRLDELAREYAEKLRAGGFSIVDGVAAIDRRRPRGNAAIGQPNNPQGHTRIQVMAQQIFGQGWSDWLEEPCALLGGECPAQLILTQTGRSRVQALLRAYEIAG